MLKVVLLLVILSLTLVDGTEIFLEADGRKLTIDADEVEHSGTVSVGGLNVGTSLTSLLSEIASLRTLVQQLNETLVETVQAQAGLAGASGPPSGVQYFASSGTFTVPEGVTTVRIEVAGGGGGGGGSSGAGGPGSQSKITISGTEYIAKGGAGGVGEGSSTSGQPPTAQSTGTCGIVLRGKGASGGQGMLETGGGNPHGTDGIAGNLCLVEVSVTPLTQASVAIGGGGTAVSGGSFKGAAGMAGYVLIEW